MSSVVDVHSRMLRIPFWPDVKGEPESDLEKLYVSRGVHSDLKHFIKSYILALLAE